MSALQDAPAWHAEAQSLRRQGMSERDIAKTLGYAPSTVHDAVKDVVPDEERPPAEATPGQQTIDGSEVPAQQEPESIEELRVDGLRQGAFPNMGGKQPQSGTITLSGGQFDLVQGTYYRKGDRLFFAGQAQVHDIGQRDKLDTKTMIPSAATQRHTARIFELHTGDVEQVIVGLFQQLIAQDRQLAAKVADGLQVEANGGADI